jgi:hypothetical protein
MRWSLNSCQFKIVTKQTVSLASLVMKDATQANWLHSLPKSEKITRTRINLTFKTIV